MADPTPAPAAPTSHPIVQSIITLFTPIIQQLEPLAVAALQAELARLFASVAPAA